MKCGKQHITDGMEVSNQEKFRKLEEKETYKYLGRLEADTMKVEMKERIKKKYLRITRNLLETKLYSRNLIKGINTWAIPSLYMRYLFWSWSEKNLRKWTNEQEN